MARRTWTKEEIDLLYLWGGDLTIDGIAAKLNRSPGSIKLKAYRLKVKLKPEVDNLSVRSIAMVLGCHPKALTYWINKGALKAKKNDASNHKSQWRVKRNQLQSFYQANHNLHIFKNAPKDNLDWLIG